MKQAKCEELEQKVAMLADIEGMENIRLGNILEAIHEAGHELNGTGLTPPECKILIRQDSENAEWLREKYTEASQQVSGSVTEGGDALEMGRVDAFAQVAEKFGIDLHIDDE